MRGLWTIASFEASRAVGVVRERDTGREASFALEAWVPCEADAAHDLQDSDERRHLLLPQAGEPVNVTWKRGWRGDEVVARVTRATPLAQVLPRRTFLGWLDAVGRIVPEVAGWTDDEWKSVFDAATNASGSYDDTVQSQEPRPPEHHWGLLAWTRANVRAAVVARRLGWLREGGAAGARRVEAWGAPSQVWLSLAADQLDALVREQLARLGD